MAVPCSGACCCSLLLFAELYSCAACCSLPCLAELCCAACCCTQPPLPVLCCGVCCCSRPFSLGSAVRNRTHFLSNAILTCTQLARCATPLDFTNTSSCLLKACSQSLAAQGSLDQGSQCTRDVTSAAGGPTS